MRTELATLPTAPASLEIIVMILLVVLGGVFTVCMLAGRFGVRCFQSWVVCLRCALAAMFLMTAWAHWGGMRPDLVRMVPPSFSDPELIVTLTGIAEIAGAVGLLIPRVAPWAATGLAILLVAMFPANIHAANAELTIGGAPATPLVPRLLMQIVLFVAVLVAGFAPRWFGSRATAARGRAEGESA